VSKEKNIVLLHRMSLKYSITNNNFMELLKTCYYSDPKKNHLIEGKHVTFLKGDKKTEGTFVTFKSVDEDENGSITYKTNQDIDKFIPSHLFDKVEIEIPVGEVKKFRCEKKLLETDNTKLEGGKMKKRTKKSNKYQIKHNKSKKMNRHTYSIKLK